MLHSSKVVETISDAIRSLSFSRIVLDPVMVAKSGTKLINDKAISNLKNKLIKKSFLITPNIPEAEVLTNTRITSVSDMIQAGKILIKLGARNVLIKGGHRKSNFVKDIFLNRNELKIFKNRKINTKNTHGTGCTLSSAIATFLSCGKPIKKSCELGIKYVNQAIKTNLIIGKGNGPINHLNSIMIRKYIK